MNLLLARLVFLSCMMCIALSYEFQTKDCSKEELKKCDNFQYCVKGEKRKPKCWPCDANASSTGGNSRTLIYGNSCEKSLRSKHIRDAFTAVIAQTLTLKRETNQLKKALYKLQVWAKLWTETTRP